jgi:hypothetical protein
MMGLYANPVFGFDTLRIGLEYWVTWTVGIIASVPITKALMANRFSNSTPAVLLRWVFVGFVLLLSFAVMTMSDASPFIYFAF